MDMFSLCNAIVYHWPVASRDFADVSLGHVLKDRLYSI